MPFYDLNDAPEQRADGVIPDGTYAAVKMTLRPGGKNVDGCSGHDIGLFKASSTSDVMYLDVEFTVISGPHQGRKIWQPLTVTGGKVGEDGVSTGWKVSKSTLRAVIDSALGLDPKDMSDAAKAKRALRGLRDLDGIEFFAKIGVERGNKTPDGGTFPDRNRITHVVVPGEPQYAALKAGKEVAPAPRRARPPHSNQNPPGSRNRPRRHSRQRQRRARPG